MEQTTRLLLTRAINVRLAQLGKTKSVLAKELGVSLPTLSNRLNGRRNFTTEHVDELAPALGFGSVDAFIAYAINQREALTHTHAA